MERVKARRPLCHLASFILAEPVTAYIQRQRDRLGGQAVDLPVDSKRKLSSYFAPDILDSTRLIVSKSLPIPELPYNVLLRSFGFHLPGASSVSAITFDYVIAARDWPSTRLLFHELIHVVQYRQLGVRRFARLYVEGFLNNGSYGRIPLESCAFSLEERFVSRGTPFDAADAVASFMARDT